MGCERSVPFREICFSERLFNVYLFQTYFSIPSLQSNSKRPGALYYH